MLRSDRQAELHRHAHGGLVQHRQHARIPQVHEIRLRIRRRAIGGRRGGEDLRFGRQLGVDFQPDDGFPGFVIHSQEELGCASRFRADRHGRR